MLLPTSTYLKSLLHGHLYEQIIYSHRYKDMKKRITLTALALTVGGLLIPVSVSAQQKSVKLTTEKAVGSSLTLIVNNSYNGITVDWGDNTPVTYTPTAGQTEQVIEGTVKGSVITISGDEQWDMLQCADCGLTEIDLTQARRLRSLYCQDNQLTTIDLRGMGNLTDLDCSNNQISSFVFTDAARPETDLSNIENLNVANNQLTGTFVVRAETLQQLNVSDNPITTLYVSSNPNLTTLISTNNDLATLNMASNRNLQTVVVRNSAPQSATFPSAGMPYLQQAVLENTTIASLNLSQSTQLSDLRCNGNSLSNLQLPETKLDNLDLRNNNLDFRFLPRRNYAPTNLLFLPQAEVNISAAPGLQQNTDGVYYMPICPSWSDRNDETYQLDLSDWRNIGVSNESSGIADITFQWFAVDENGAVTELTQGRSQSAPNDFYASTGKFAFFTGQGRIYATMSSRTYSLELNTMPISVGENFTTGIGNVISDDSGLSVRTTSGCLIMSCDQPTTINVYAIDGKTVWSGTVGQDEQTVRLPKGIYIVNNQKVAL